MTNTNNSMGQNNRIYCIYYIILAYMCINVYVNILQSPKALFINVNYSPKLIQEITESYIFSIKKLQHIFVTSF